MKPIFTLDFAKSFGDKFKPTWVTEAIKVFNLQWNMNICQTENLNDSISNYIKDNPTGNYVIMYNYFDFNLDVAGVTDAFTNTPKDHVCWILIKNVTLEQFTDLVKRTMDLKAFL